MTPARKRRLLTKLAASKASVLDKIVGSVAGRPLRKGGSGIMDILLGRKGKRGYTKGRRLKEVKGVRGLQEISEKEFRRLKANPSLGTAVEATINGKKVFAKRKHLPGGAAGWVARNPGKSAAGAFLGYHALKSPVGRQMAQAFVPENRMRMRSEQIVPLNPPTPGEGAWG